VDNQKLKKMFAPVWPEVQGVWTRDIFRDVFKSHSNTLDRPQDYINHSLYFEAKTFLHGLFVVEDKLSMAHGLETRVPFMDNDLVDFAMQCPVGMKIHNLRENYRINENEMVNKKQQYFRKTNDGKQILRTTMKRLIPMDVVLAEKQGFSGPDASWFKRESNDFLQSKLFDKKANIYEFLDYETTVDLVNQHLSGRQNLRLLIWSLLNVEYWMASTL
jgi:asparagine synthase (glutamine-hydrolysing)